MIPRMDAAGCLPISIPCVCLADKTMALFSMATCPTNCSGHEILQLGMTKLRSSGWVGLSEILLGRENRGGWDSYFTPFPALIVDTTSNGRQQPSRGYEATMQRLPETPSDIVNPLTPCHNCLLLSVVMESKENPCFIQIPVSKVFFYLPPNALLMHHLPAFL